MRETHQEDFAGETASAAVDFFDHVADEDLLRFLRSLPIVGANDGEQFTIEDLTYEALLQPFVVHAWKQVAGDPGIPGRILQLNRVYHAAEAALERETGRKRRIPRIIDLPAFLHAYSSRGLPL